MEFLDITDVINKLISEYEMLKERARQSNESFKSIDEYVTSRLQAQALELIRDVESSPDLQETLTIEQKMALASMAKSSEYARKIYESKEYKSYLRRFDLPSHGDDPYFLAAMLGYNKRKLLSFLLRHKKDNNISFMVTIAEIIAEQDPKFMKKIADGRFAVDGLEFSRRLDYKNRVYTADKRKNNQRLLRKKPNEKMVEKIALTQQFQTIAEYYIKYNKMLLPALRTMLVEAMLSISREETLKFLHSRVLQRDPYCFIRSVLVNTGLTNEDIGCKVLETKGLTTINPQELALRKDVDYVSIPVGEREEYCTVDETVEMVQAYHKLFGDIMKAEPNDPRSQYVTLRQIVDRIHSLIEYDFYSISDKGEQDQELMFKRNTIYNALVKRKAICEGLARALEFVSREKGVDCWTVVGFLRTKSDNKREIKRYKPVCPTINKEELDYLAIESLFDYDHNSRSHRALLAYDNDKSGHAWNQVRIGEHVFNLDITREFNPKKFLFSDTEFKGTGFERKLRYYRYRTSHYKDSVRCPLSFEEAFPELAEEPKRGIKLSSLRELLFHRRKTKKPEEDEQN